KNQKPKTKNQKPKTMFLQEIQGQTNIKKRLLQAVANNRLPHALLFLGKEGVGELPLALAFAQYINCENRTETDSCGQCANCRKAHKGIHPDIHYVYPILAKEDGKDMTADDFVDKFREITKE